MDCLWASQASRHLCKFRSFTDTWESCLCIFAQCCRYVLWCFPASSNWIIWCSLAVFLLMKHHLWRSLIHSPKASLCHGNWKQNQVQIVNKMSMCSSTFHVLVHSFLISYMRKKKTFRMVLRFQTQCPVLWYLGLLEGNKNSFTPLPSCPYSSFSPKPALTLRKVPFPSTSPESHADLLWAGCYVTRLWYQDEDNLKKTEFKFHCGGEAQQ